MNCENVKTCFADYLSAELETKMMARIQAHLADCIDCRSELEEINGMWLKLGVLPQEPPSPQMRKRFYAMLDSYIEGQEKGESAVRPLQLIQSLWMRWWNHAPAVQLVSVTALLLIGILAGSLINPLGSSSKDVTLLQNELMQTQRLASVSLMRQESASDRLRGLSLTSSLDLPGQDVIGTLFDLLNDDPNLNVRLSAVDALYLFSDKREVRQGLLESLNQQESPLIQLALIDLLVDIRERRAVEALKGLIKSRDLNPSVKERIEQLLVGQKL